MNGLKASSISILALVLLVAPLALSGCGSGAKKGWYTDAKYGFSFKIPKGWSVASSGSVQKGQGYVLQFNKPFGMRINVGPPVPKLLDIKNGEVIRKKPPVCPLQCSFHLLQVDGYAAVRVLETKINSAFLFADYVTVNSKRYSYNLQLRMNHIGSALDSKLATLVNSFTINKND